MFKSIKEFFRSYNSEALKPSLVWMAKHWKGTIIFTIVSYAILCAGVIARGVISYEIPLKDMLPEKIVNKFSKKETED